MTNETDAAQAADEPPTVAEPDIGAAAAEPETAEETPRGAIDRAFNAVVSHDEEGQEQPGASKDEAATGQPRGGQETPTGAQGRETTGPEDVAPRNPNEAPNRFSPDAKDAWMDAPLPVRAEVRRMEREFEAGIEKYRGDAEAFGEYRQFADMLAETGQTFDEVLSHYVGIENQLARDPIGGLDLICQNLGTSLQDVAAQVLNEPSDGPAQLEDPMIDGLRSEIADLQSQLGGLTTTFLGEKSDLATRQINEFSANNPRFDELSGDIAFFLTTNRASDLQEAYAMAERLNPAPVASVSETSSTAAQTRNTPAEAAQTRKGQLSVTGAPGTGSNPANRPSPKTARAAIDNAFAVMGIG